MERFKIQVTPVFQQTVKQALLNMAPCQEKPEQNCAYRLDYNGVQGWARVKQFTNGTFYVEATDPALYQEISALVQKTTGTAVPKASVTSQKSDSALSPVRGKIEVVEPYIGTDESGKGDYFGPLVIAGVFTTPETWVKLEQMGVMDSKLLKDAQMRTMAAQIQTLLGPEGFSIIEISPKRYNELYDSFKQSGKNLNHLLAWGHAKVLETLLEKHPDCNAAIADQFGSEHYIRSQLQTRGKAIKLHQTPKAEANIGVAAASILARVRFVQKMQTLGNQVGTPLPFGAGANVLACAKQLVNAKGKDILKQVAKYHFKTTESVLLAAKT